MIALTALSLPRGSGESSSWSGIAAIAKACSAQDCYQAALDEAKRSSAAAPVVEALRGAANRMPEDYQTQQGWVLITLQNAFYQLLRVLTEWRP